MQKLLQSTLAVAFFLAALMTSNVAKAQSVPYFVTQHQSCRIAVGETHGINYEIYTAGYEMESLSFDYQTGAVTIVQESYYETRTNFYSLGLRIKGISVIEITVKISITYIDSHGETYTIEAYLQCTIFEEIEPTGVTDSQPLSPLSTDSNRLPVIIPQED